jgi:magnesium chelatase subunit D
MAAVALLAIDPHGLGGIHVRAAAGPVRQRWLDQLSLALEAADAPVAGHDPTPAGRGLAVRRPGPPHWRKLPLSIGDDRLIGGIDLAATLAAGRPIAQRGILSESDGRVIVVPMAERLATAIAAQLAIALDRGEVQVAREGISAVQAARFGLVALDESGPDDDPFAPALAERLGLSIDLGGLVLRDLEAVAVLPGDLARARSMLAAVRASDEVVQALCAAALALGVASLRASWFALRAACASAAWQGRGEVSDEDAARAVRLVLSARATRLPALEPPADESQEPPEPESAPPPEDPPPPDSDPPEPDPEAPIPDEPLEDRLLEAAAAAIPPGLLLQLQLGRAARSRSRSSGKAGQARLGGRRGAPIGVRREAPRGDTRLSLIDTLRAAAPWQRVRRNAAGAAARSSGVHVRPEDFHVRRHRQRSATTTVFAVDASGSQALHRLAEAKGAVELMLAECYVRRDSVALVAFRGVGAEVLLPPTRSLVRARRSLAGLPGGGGTPLALGLEVAFGVADAVRRRGDTPMLVLLTDGRANIARDGSPGRPQAEIDAKRAARQWRAAGLRTLLIDTAPQSQPLARNLALEMGATYLALPHADARAVSQAVGAVQRSLGAARA